VRLVFPSKNCIALNPRCKNHYACITHVHLGLGVWLQWARGLCKYTFFRCSYL